MESSRATAEHVRVPRARDERHGSDAARMRLPRPLRAAINGGSRPLPRLLVTLVTNRLIRGHVSVYVAVSSARARGCCHQLEGAFGVAFWLGMEWDHFTLSAHLCVPRAHKVRRKSRYSPFTCEYASKARESVAAYINSVPSVRRFSFRRSRR